MANIFKENDEDLFLFEHYNIKVDEGQASIRIDKFLLDKIPNTSRNRIQNAIQAQFVRVNQAVVKPNYKVRPKDEISISFPEPPRDTDILPENIPLSIVYEDEELLVVNKEAGMVVHPAYNNWTGTLVNALVYHFKQLPTSRNGEGRPGLVHRIDKDTSGLLVIAKTEDAMTHLARQFYDHSIERKYQALVWGVPQLPEGTVDVHLGRSLKDRKVVVAYPAADYGKHAITHYKVLQSMHYVSWIECRLETGRTHQIRAHMKYLGHPLFNDVTYGGDKVLKGPAFSKYKQFVKNCFQMLPRQALHAKSLGFIHPKTNKRLYFESDLPEDLASVLDKWSKFGSNLDNQ